MQNNMVLSVAVITYNQEKYIAQTLDSILQQKHDYSYEIVIGDDASHDKTQEIILEYQKNYPNIIIPIFNKKNMGILKNFSNVLLNCKGEYVMECAGDDWWLPGKVQTQIEYMEKNPEVGMCYGKIKIYGGKKKSCSIRETFEDFLYRGNNVPAVTTCYKNLLYKQYIKEIQPEKQDWLMEDYPMWLYMSKTSCVKFINSYFACYRVLNDSASHSTNFQKKLDFENSVYCIRAFFSEKYNKKIDKMNEHKMRGNIYSILGDYKNAYKEYDQVNIHDMKNTIEKMLHKNSVSYMIMTFYRKIKNKCLKEL